MYIYIYAYASANVYIYIHVYVRIEFLRTEVPSFFMEKTHLDKGNFCSFIHSSLFLQMFLLKVDL